MGTLAWLPRALSRPGTRATAAADQRSSLPGRTWIACTAVPRRFVVLRMIYESSAIGVEMLRSPRAGCVPHPSRPRDSPPASAGIDAP